MNEPVPLPSNARWTQAATTSFDRPDWHHQAACRGCDPDLFYPERGATVTAAKAICAACPVRGECLDYALEVGEHHGIWGGTSERQRKRIRLGVAVGARRGSIGAARRRQVASMRADGVTVTQIARELGLCRRTVHRYLEAAS